MKLSRLLPITLVACLANTAPAASSDPLESGFRNPPTPAKPQTWWHWMNGNISREGITADLEAMKQIGLAGATVINLGCDIPFGGVSFMSPEWQKDFKFAVEEANRVGLKLSVMNCAGWSNSGGPWITPPDAMQRLTSSETQVSGPAKFDNVLSKPPTNLDYYRDIGVLAFPDPSSESGDRRATEPLQIKRADYKGRDNGGSADVAERLRELIRSGKKSVVVDNDEMGGDPAIFSTKILSVDLAIGGKSATVELGQGDTFVFPENSGQLDVASAFDHTLPGRTFVQPPPATIPSATGAVPLADVLDLSGKMDENGRLRWDVPPGKWIVVRIGYSPVGRHNHPAPEGGEGLECDKLSKSGMDAHWAGFMQKVLDDAGPLASKTLNASLIDSYEVGLQDWTGKFREEFQKRRGYDPLPYLVTFNRYLVESPEVTTRFLWDMRRTIADLFAENYYGRFAELCRENGLLSTIQPYTGPFESLQSGAAADVVMGEFWANGESTHTVKVAASVAHIYGKNVVGAESFTGWPSDGRWLADPYSLKPIGDLMFCYGANAFTFHRYAMQPWQDRFPGMTMGPFGINFERTQTWWTQGKAWIDYISRCQFLLQQGRPVADVAYFTGQTAPIVAPEKDPAMPLGYDYDHVNADVLLDGATVKDGRLTLASSASYAVLVLPPGDIDMTPVLLDRLRTLVREGATIVGPRPKRSPSLQDYPRCDQQVEQIAEELWGPCDGKTVFEHAFGKGRVVWGKPLTDVFTSLGLKPDFEFDLTGADKQLSYVHRVDDETDIYFVSNQQRQSVSAECTFRVTGKVPELWNPENGAIEPAPIWNDEDGRTRVNLDLHPAGSTFVIFRPTSAKSDQVIAASGKPATGSTAKPKLEIRKAIYAATDGPSELDVTANVSKLVRDGRLVIPATTEVLGGDPAPFHVKELRVDYTLDGKAGNVVTREGDTLILGEPLEWEVRVDESGAPLVKAWSDARVELQTARGKTLLAEAKDLPPPQDITGPWKVNFPKNWGAPPSITLNELVSWADHADTGVRYFSGSAVYEKDIEIPSESLKNGREVWLDLGEVKNFAEVSLNGRELGVLWKPPYRVNVTAAAKPGRNKLAIRVTNLWPNRLIGDEQLPADVEWKEDGSLVRLPQWMLDGKPSPTGRLTFTTWHHWNKNDPLLPSGLLGPITLRTAEVVYPSVGTERKN